MQTKQSDPALVLAARIYAFKKDSEAWTTAVDKYAREVLTRHPRTVHRWLTGESPIPLTVINFLRIEIVNPASYRSRHDAAQEIRP